MRLLGFGMLLWAVLCPGVRGADEVRLATYNIENYLLSAGGNRAAKPEAAKAAVAEFLAGLRADIVGLQEVGGLEGLEDLRQRTARLGWEYGHWEHVRGWDTNIQVALLSRHPIVARRSHTGDAYLVSGRRYRVSRGILEVDVRVGAREVWTVFVVHLKSRRPVSHADQAEMRREEARILREKIDQRLRADPTARLLVLGDLNDTRDSEAVRAVIGRGRGRLADTRPAERRDGAGPVSNPAGPGDARVVTWTYFYGVKDTYDRIDYILLGPSLEKAWVRGASYLPVWDGWGIASDHRPVVVTLRTGTR